MQSKIPGQIFSFKAITTCPVKNFDELGLDEVVSVKIGEKVMFTRNDSANRFFNGSMGKVSYISGDVIEVFSEKSQSTFLLERYKTDINGVSNGKKIKIGEVSQFPIRLCYAITVHKCQGITLDSDVDVSFDQGFSPAGMALVALSRSKDYRKMNVVGLSPNVIKIDRNVLNFINNTKFEQL